jgi:hypothetical protein
MSRAYRVRIPLPVGHLANQTYVLSVQLLPILEPARMQELLQNLWIKDGAVEGPDGWALTKNGLTYTLTGAGTFTMSFNARDSELMIDDDFLTPEALAKVKQPRGRLSAEDPPPRLSADDLPLAHQEILAQLQTEATRRFAQGIEAGQLLLNQMLKQVYQEALKQKAEALGNVTLISETQEGQEYRMRMVIESSC